ncbi:MAG: hypothetical protein ACNA76_03975 [Anaerosomatales bacterium]
MNAYLPPLVIDVRVRKPGSRNFRIWLPLFLLWPVLLVLFGFALLVAVLIDAALLASGARYHHYTLLLLVSLRVLAGVRGTHINALSDDDIVKVTGGKDKVDVKVPLAVLRAGLKLTSLIPPQAMDQISESMGEHGMSLDFNNLKPEDIEELIASLREMEINVHSENGENVRVFCA